MSDTFVAKITKPNDLNNPTRSVAEFTENAYLNYAMYVIMDRALPHVADGLKPSLGSKIRPNPKNQRALSVTSLVNTIRMATPPVMKPWC